MLLLNSLDGDQIFDINHTITLAMEGREVPRRRPGRPRKVKPPEDAPAEMTNTETSTGDDFVDPEHALELMFKEAEEKRQTSGDLTRSRRRRRVPRRYVLFLNYRS